MSLVAQLTAAFQAIGTDIKSIQLDIGNKTALSTTDKTNLVNAINEVLNKTNSLIDDLAGVGITNKTWSADKIIAYAQQIKSDIFGGTVPAALDTLLEIANQLQDDETELNSIALALGNRVRVDAAQTFTAPQKQQARENIDAASDTEFQQFKTDVGDVATDFVDVYVAAKT